MPHTGINSINVRDLNILAGASLVVIVTSVTVGSIVAPSPWTHTTVKGTKCVAAEGTTQQEWFLPEGPTRCHALAHTDTSPTHTDTLPPHSDTVIHTDTLLHTETRTEPDTHRQEDTQPDSDNTPRHRQDSSTSAVHKKDTSTSLHPDASERNNTASLHSFTSTQLASSSSLHPAAPLDTSPLHHANTSLRALHASTSQNASLLSNTSLHNIVFAFQFPGQPQGASRWQQRLAGLLRLRLVHHQGWWGAGGGRQLSLVTRLGYSDQPSAPPALLAHTVQARHISCNPRQEHRFGGATYHCAPVPLVVLYSLYHPHYLVNIRVEGEGQGLHHIQDLYVSFISQDGRYTRVLVALQTLFFPALASLLLWYLSALRRPQHPAATAMPYTSSTLTTAIPYTATTVTTAIPYTSSTVTTAVPYTSSTAIHYTASPTTAIMVIPSKSTVTTPTAMPIAPTSTDMITTATVTATPATATVTATPATTTAPALATLTTLTATTTDVATASTTPRAIPITAISRTTTALTITATSPTTASITATSPTATSPTATVPTLTATTPTAVTATAPATLTYFQIMLLLLASALLLVNCPWTYLTLVVDCPWLVILQELCLGLFYASFMTFLHFLTHLYLEPVNRCPKVRTAMARVIGGYAGALLLVECTEHWLLLHNPLPASWESLHLGLATITVLLVLTYLAYITVRVYNAVKVLRRRAAGRMRRDPTRVRAHVISWSKEQGTARDTERVRDLGGTEKDQVMQQPYQDKEQLRTSKKEPLEKEQLSDSEKPLRDPGKGPLGDPGKALLREPEPLGEPEREPLRDPEKGPQRYLKKNGGGVWCDLVRDKREEGWWREGGVLLVSWLCVLLTAAEFIIKRLHDGMWIWEDIFGNLEIENTSGLLLGVYSAWNVFTCVALLAYPPQPPPPPRPHTPTLGVTEVMAEGLSVQQQEQQRRQSHHQWSEEGRQLWQEGYRHWQHQRPPLVRQDAIDIVSLDSLEGVVVVSGGRAESQETDGGVVRLAVLSTDCLISNDDAVSVYLISADSVASAEVAVGEGYVSRESGRTGASAISNSASALSNSASADNEALTTTTSLATGAGRSHSRATDLSPSGESEGPGASFSSGGGGGRPGGERNTPSLVLVNGVDARSLDDDGSDIGMIDEDPGCDIGVGDSGVCGGGGVSGVCGGASSVCGGGGVSSVCGGNADVSGAGGSHGGVCDGGARGVYGGVSVSSAGGASGGAGDVRGISGANNSGVSCSVSGDDVSSGISGGEGVMNGKASFGSDTRSITDSL